VQAIWDGIREGMGWILSFFYGIVPNAGFAIIMLTVVVRLILFPLTAKQAKSMIAMQRAQPEMKKLQAKYKNDKQKLNEELMKFYKENQINPLGGCLPLLAQMPIFIALYQTLREIQHFIPKDSSMYADICSGVNCKVVNLDFFGMNLTQSASNAPKGFWNALPYFVLVGLVVITAFLQQRQTMRNQTQVNPQMQVIGKVMPIIFGFISINIPAGVVLYFFTSNLWQIGQQEVVFRTIGTAAGPPAKKGDKAGGKAPDKGGGKSAPPIEAKSTETPPPSAGGVKGLFKSLSPGSATPEDAAPSGNGKPQPADPGTGAKGSGSGAQKPKNPPAATKKKSPPATPKQPDAGSGNGSPTGRSTSARRRNNRKRKR
jgi:YidC/Oxa1 family membrane protein insertase